MDTLAVIYSLVKNLWGFGEPRFAAWCPWGRVWGGVAIGVLTIALRRLEWYQHIK